ncbi:translation elongation factor Ts [Polyangium jinanense]|uniref:Elongation factor Ts n=1 Tax=Polyangium jinanense TaxID=2829994 RepID=A0A9X3XCV2_9BACT|nr:translation elongation factor Ts [Polyangium jinanense]MDC3956566.1 translation elongation factor Ts [Polyangium jinanense]MDC3985651.1 translation elongation factor Ts [Polyangium jinanense]
MAGINPQAIKELRERTQAGMSDCKNALTEAEGDMEKAVEIILKKGLAKSAKRAGAVASEGEVRASISTDKRAATLVEVNIQTDFSARSDEFKNFVGDVLCLAEAAPLGADLKNSDLRGKKVGDVIVDLTARIGEKIDIRRWDRTEVPAGKSGVAHAYVHLGGKIGVVLSLETESDAVAQHAEVLKFADETAMQIAAMNPVALVREDISDDAKAKQKEIFEGQLREDPKPKPESAWPKIIEGKFNKWFSEVTLTEQESVVVPGQTIDKLRQAAEKAAGGSVKIVRFVRYERGEGIEKPQGPDFASEVAKMAGG